MNNLQSQINPGTDAVFRGFREGITAARVGTAATGVLVFVGVGVGEEGTTYNLTTDPAQGTRIAISRAGLYAVSVRLQNAGGAPVFSAVSMNTNAAGLVATPSWALIGAQDFQQGAGDDGGGNPASLNLDALVKVTGGDIAAGIADGASGAQIRIHATNAAAAPAGLVIATASMQLRRIAPVF